MAIFLLLSFLSGMLELGGVFLGCLYGLPVWAVLAIAAMYQLGNFISELIHFNKAERNMMTLIIAALFVRNIFSFSALAFAIQVFLCSLYIQTLRAEYKKECPTWLKRCFRIAGFTLSPLTAYFPEYVILGICIFSFAVANFSKGGKAAAVNTSTSRNYRISAVMVLHQMHYFTYTYIMLITAYLITGNMLVSALMFAATWLVYLIPQTVFDLRRLSDNRFTFFVCHGFLAVMLLLLTLAFQRSDIYIGAAAWLLTGLGGGSVFCIKKLSRTEQRCNMPLSENVGHLAGAAVGIMIALLSDGFCPLYFTEAAFIVVGLAMIFAYWSVRKEVCYHE